MQTIHDEKTVQALIRQGGIDRYFSTPGLQFHARAYQKGELITTQNLTPELIQFVVEGTVRVYGLREDGSLSPINQQNAPLILGDIEFTEPGRSPFFTQAVTDVMCVVLPLKPNAEALHKDLRFLHALLHSYVDKLNFFTYVDASAETIEDRVLLYLKNFCPDHELPGIEATVSRLRCSRRQLQRVLRKLCDEGVVEKTGKGHYKLR